METLTYKQQDEIVAMLSSLDLEQRMLAYTLLLEYEKPVMMKNYKIPPRNFYIASLMSYDAVYPFTTIVHSLAVSDLYSLQNNYGREQINIIRQLLDKYK